MATARRSRAIGSGSVLGPVAQVSASRRVFAVSGSVTQERATYCSTTLKPTTLTRVVKRPSARTGSGGVIL